MGFLRRLLGGSADESSASAARRVEVPAVEQPGALVAGTEYHAPALARASEGPAVFTIQCEPDNPHDPHAVMVRYRGQHIGYLPATRAAAYAPVVAQLEREGECVVRGELRNWEQGLGARLYLPPAEVLQVWARASPEQRETIDLQGAKTVRLKRLKDYLNQHVVLLDGRRRVDVMATATASSTPSGKYKGEPFLTFTVGDAPIGVLQAQYRDDAPGLFDKAATEGPQEVTVTLRVWDDPVDDERPTSATFEYVGS